MKYASDLDHETNETERNVMRQTINWQNVMSYGGAVFGAAIVGASIALLFAPRSGKETRRKIAEQSKRMQHDLLERSRSLGRVAKETGSTLKQAVQQPGDTASRVSSSIPSGLSDGKSSAEKVLS